MSFIINCYAWYFPILAFLYIISVNKKKEHLLNDRVDSNNRNDSLSNYRVSFLFAFVVFLPMILIAGFREGINHNAFSDTGLYVSLFNSYPDSLDELDLSNSSDKMFGWKIFSVFIKQFISTDYRYWLLIIAAISGLCLLNGFRKNTDEIVFCAFMFFISYDFFAWMMNGIRQFLAVSIIFMFANILFTRKAKNIILFILLVLLLSNIHSSCLLVIPLYLISLGKPFNRNVLIVMFLCLVSVFFLDQFTDFLDASLELTHYNGVTSQMMIDDGTNPIRVILYSFPAIIIILFRKKIPDNIPPIISFSINASLISMGIYVISIFTSGIFIGRIPIYFSLFNYILIPWEIKTFFSVQNRKLIYILIIIVYFIYFILQVRLAGLI